MDDLNLMRHMLPDYPIRDHGPLARKAASLREHLRQLSAHGASPMQVQLLAGMADDLAELCRAFEDTNAPVERVVRLAVIDGGRT